MKIINKKLENIEEKSKWRRKSIRFAKSKIELNSNIEKIYIDKKTIKLLKKIILFIKKLSSC